MRRRSSRRDDRAGCRPAAPPLPGERRRERPPPPPQRRGQRMCSSSRWRRHGEEPRAQRCEHRWAAQRLHRSSTRHAYRRPRVSRHPLCPVPTLRAQPLPRRTRPPPRHQRSSMGAAAAGDHEPDHRPMRPNPPHPHVCRRKARCQSRATQGRVPAGWPGGDTTKRSACPPPPLPCRLA